MSSHVPADRTRTDALWPGWFAATVRLAIAPAILFFIGFITCDFLLSGLYTWPRTSRTIVLTLTAAVLAYEFVYKEHGLRHGGGSPRSSLKALLYSCLIPYAIGALALLALARLIPL